MELVHAHHITFDELMSEKMDVFIAACGYELRCSHLIQLSNFNASRKIALLFKENNDKGSRKINETIFREHGFDCYELSGGSAQEIKAVLSDICNSQDCQEVKLLIDYSSMSKVWYGSIINYFIFNDLSLRNLVVYFSYTPEHFIVNKKTSNLKEPVPMVQNKVQINTQKPVALVVGLGSDDKKVEFLCNFFKPSQINLFLASPSFNDDYTRELKDRNKNLLTISNNQSVYSYSATNIDDIDAKLTSICMNLRINYRIILVSLGPKTFSLASFLLNARYPDIEIWNMSDSDQILDLKPAGLPLVYKAILTQECDED